MSIQQKLITLAEFEAFTRAHPEGLFELINGEIVEKMTTEQHGQIAAIIVSEIRFFLRQHPAIEGVYGVEVSYHIGDNYNELRPDVSFRLTDEEASDSILDSLPDFAVEVKSPNNTYKELRAKALLYLQQGSRLVWLVYPEKKIVEVFEQGTDSELYKEDETLSGSPVLEGFQLAVKEIFGK
jgi:Uma2 family endonuclease